MGLLAALGLGGLAGGCKKEEPPPPAAEEPAPPPTPCPGGRSDDPPRAEIVEANRLFRNQKYAEARAAADKLIEAKPNSVTALALRGDATLFDDALGYEEAARQARTYYDRASAILAQGCRVPRRTEYYLHMGDAFAALRLAARDGGTFDAAELKRSEEALRLAEKRWPQSAEVHYNLARVHCARQNELDACVQRFEQALEAAESLERPRFLRTHRSLEDWIVRSETQSEFTALRADPRYKQAIDKARARQAEAAKKRSGSDKDARPGERRFPGPRLRPDPRTPASKPSLDPEATPDSKSPPQPQAEP